MKRSVFRYPYSKVFRRSKDVLSQMGMKIISSDSVKGSIRAKSGFSLMKPVLQVDLTVEELENNNTRVTIHGITAKAHFFQKTHFADASEAEILDAISSNM